MRAARPTTRARLSELRPVNRAEPVGLGGGEGYLFLGHGRYYTWFLTRSSATFARWCALVDHLDPVADRLVEGRVTGAQSPAPLGLLCDQNCLLGLLGYLLEGTGVWGLAVVAPVAEDYDRHAVV